LLVLSNFQWLFVILFDQLFCIIILYTVLLFTFSSNVYVSYPVYSPINNVHILYDRQYKWFKGSWGRYTWAIILPHCVDRYAINNVAGTYNGNFNVDWKWQLTQSEQLTDIFWIKCDDLVLTRGGSHKKKTRRGRKIIWL